VILEIKKKHSTGLSERDLIYVASSTGSRFFGTESRETNCLCLYVNLVSSFTCNHFELAPKIITLIEKLMARRTIFCTPILLLLILTLTSGEIRVQSL
jgi:hypothetical protein